MTLSSALNRDDKFMLLTNAAEDTTRASDGIGWFIELDRSFQEEIMLKVDSRTLEIHREILLRRVPS